MTVEAVLERPAVGGEPSGGVDGGGVPCQVVVVVLSCGGAGGVGGRRWWWLCVLRLLTAWKRDHHLLHTRCHGDHYKHLPCVRTLDHPEEENHVKHQINRHSELAAGVRGLETPQKHAS